MTKIKICGITNIEDAKSALDFGADALGFVLYEKSDRYVRPEEAGQIISKLPPFVTTVGVFVNPGLEELKEVRNVAGFDAVQLHGDESPDFCSKVRGTLIKAIRVRGPLDRTGIESYPVRAILFDTYSEVAYGGTGESFTWDLLKGFNISQRVILSGGLSPENVAYAVKSVKPYAVDVSSGVEEYPGKKNRMKIKKFIEAVRDGEKVEASG